MEITRCKPMGKEEGWYNAIGTRYYHQFDVDALAAEVRRLQEENADIRKALDQCRELLKINSDAVGNYRAKLKTVRNETLTAAAKVAREQKGRIGSLTGTWYVPTAEDIAAAIERLKEK